MKRLIAFALTFIFALALAGCNNIAANEPKMYTSSMQDDFPNAIPAEVNDNIMTNVSKYPSNPMTTSFRIAQFFQKTWAMKLAK